MRFVLSFSGGKDSILALHRMLEAGHEAAALLVMFRREQERSWVHGIDREILNATADALHLPLLCCDADAQTYERDMENCLRTARERFKAEACVFGDIDIPEHRAWDEARCAAAGIQAYLPLWGCDRKENVLEAVKLGYRCVIQCVRRGVLPQSFLGRPLSFELLEEMAAYGIDLCGENGEYHTIVVDGPLFVRPVELENRGTIHLDYVDAADFVLADSSSSV